MKHVLVAAVAIAIAAPATGHAFCGFYVASHGHKLVNDATQVVVMRKGTRTVLSVQSTYKGPVEAFAMVVPVPVLLEQTDIKTLPKDVFARVEALGAPRLVEYWEQDPCGNADVVAPAGERADAVDAGVPAVAGDGVAVEASFVAGEYQIVILSAKDSRGLVAWLVQDGYRIPDGAELLVRPYVESGSKFLIAKVDPSKVTFSDGRATLSPLRVHYDSEDFMLPIRIGLASSQGTQDLIVNIFAPDHRYEVANYKNVTIPTNLDVSPDLSAAFASFYAALFDATLAKHPGAVVTEYAWQAVTCDACPGPALDEADYLTLGGDVLDATPSGSDATARAELVLTRLHMRYGKTSGDDLRFRRAHAIAGGREIVVASGRRQPGAQPAERNAFQARYAIRHPWIGALRCDKPRRGVWGLVPPKGGPSSPRAAIELALAPRDTVPLATAVLGDVPEIDLRTGTQRTAIPPPTPGSGAIEVKKQSGCGCATSERNDVLWGALLVGVSGLLQRRRARCKATWRDARFRRLGPDACEPVRRPTAP